MAPEIRPPTPLQMATSLFALVSGIGLLLAPAMWALSGYKPVASKGIATLDEAVAVCQRSGLAGWELATFAQCLVHWKFAYYSCRNLWDTPAQAFRRGMGYCTQYNLALKQLLDGLGFETQAVFSLKVRVADLPDWTMGHTWLRVFVDGETRDVCAGRASNLPGRVNFTPVGPVWPGSAPVFLLTHLGMILFCGFLEWRALVTRRPPPEWMFHAQR
jgi:hypothetical protein